MPDENEETTGRLTLPASAERFHSLLLEWYAAHARDLPWRRTSDPYAILVSEVMLQQTQAERVVPKYQEFLQRFPTFGSLAAASTAEVIRAWAPLGYNRRAIYLQRVARVVFSEHDGELPRDARALRVLPGIGRYTAAAVACFAFGSAAPIVDTNIRRVLGRLHRRQEMSPTEAERLALECLPADRAGDWSQALMDLGATICTATAPACLLCPLRSVCPSRGIQARESRQRYRAAAATAPFKGSDRYLRGRIVDLLRDLEPEAGLSPTVIGATLGLEADQNERLKRLLQALQRDGLAVIDTAGLVQLPQ